MTLTVYGDFTDLLSYIASLRVDALRLADTPVEWRAVTEESTTTTSVPLGAAALERLEEMRHWWREHRLAGDPPDAPPPSFRPYGLPPLSGYAEAVVAGVGDHVRHRIFSAFCVGHQDIGNPDLLRRLLAVPLIRGRSTASVHREHGYAVAIGGGPVTTEAWRLMRQWRTGWEGTGRTELPVVTDGVDVLGGYQALEHLAELVGDQRIPSGRENPYPLPPLPVWAHRRGLPPAPRPGWWEAEPGTELVSRPAA